MWCDAINSHVSVLHQKSDALHQKIDAVHWKSNKLHGHFIGKRCHQIIVHRITSLCQCNTDALYWKIRCKQCNTGPHIALAMQCDKGPIQCNTYACIASVTLLVTTTSKHYDITNRSVTQLTLLFPLVHVPVIQSTSSFPPSIFWSL
jgi:hypothetical protein